MQCVAPAAGNGEQKAKLIVNIKGSQRLDALRATANPEGSTLDLVITNGRVIDPETKLDAVRNVGIDDGRIAAVSEAPLKGQRVMPGAIIASDSMPWLSTKTGEEVEDMCGRCRRMPLPTRAAQALMRGSLASTCVNAS